MFNEDIKESLQQKGYLVIEDKLNYTDFVKLSEKLGSCELYSDIKITANTSSYITTAKTVPIHNDCPLIDYIGWYCKEQDNIDGDSMLVDGHKLLDCLTEDDIKRLMQIEIAYLNYQTGKKEKTYVLTKNHGKENFFFAPWLLININQDWIDDTLQLVASKLRELCFSVRLTPGQALFVDNQRFLHGRNSLTAESNRWLKRIWIKKHVD